MFNVVDSVALSWASGLDIRPAGAARETGHWPQEGDGESPGAPGGAVQEGERGGRLTLWATETGIVLLVSTSFTFLMMNVWINTAFLKCERLKKKTNVML